MVAKVTLLLLGAVLLLQSSNARYHDMDTALRAIEERLKLLKYTRTEFSDMTEAIIGKGTILMEKVLKDPKILAVESNVMKSNLYEIRRFLEKYQEYKKGAIHEEVSPQVFRSNYFHLISKYDEKRTLETSEEKVIAIAFKENGIDEVRDYIQERAKVFTEKFYDQVQKYVEGLNETQKKDESELFDLMDAYKAEPNILKRGDLLFKFMENVNIEKFLW